MLLSIVDRGRHAPTFATCLRSMRGSVRCSNFQHLRVPLVSILLFALALSIPAANAAPASPSKVADNSAWELAQSNPAALVEQAVQKGLQDSYGRGIPSRYLLRKITRNTDTTKEIVETADGGVAHLIAIRNKPLTAAQQQAEMQRLHTLASNPALQRHRHRSEDRDAARIRHTLRLLPQAFLYHAMGSGETSDGQIELSFTPNPHFSPPTLESDILTGVRGEVWIDAHDLRMTRIDAHLFRTIDFGWGILGSLYPGGTMQIEQAKTAECGWQLTYVNLNLNGKELLFKALRIVLQESLTDYHPVPANWKYTDAIQWLLHMSSSLAAQSKSVHP